MRPLYLQSLSLHTRPVEPILMYEECLCSIMSPRVRTVEGRNTACTLSLWNLMVMLSFFESLPAVAFIHSVRALTLHKDTQRDVLFQQS
jgi:hypothetical protein